MPTPMRRNSNTLDLSAAFGYAVVAGVAGLVIILLALASIYLIIILASADMLIDFYFTRKHVQIDTPMSALPFFVIALALFLSLVITLFRLTLQELQWLNGDGPVSKWPWQDLDSVSIYRSYENYVVVVLEMCGVPRLTTASIRHKSSGKLCKIDLTHFGENTKEVGDLLSDLWSQSLGGGAGK